MGSKKTLVLCLVVWLGIFVIQASEQGDLSTVQAGPEISIDRDRLNFGACTTGEQTGSQTLMILCTGGYINWTVTGDAAWLDYSPASGTNNGEVSVWVDPAGLTPGTYTGTITVSAPAAANSPQTVTVKLVVYSTTTGPDGRVDTPVNGSTVSGSIPVTGWAVDDIGFKEVMIYRRDNHYGKWREIYIGTGLFVEGARPDVEALFPNSPMNYMAGWGYMLLTNCLPNEGNGTFTIFADGIDLEGNRKMLGYRTITCDNANAVKPFGTIDLPFPGRIASGKKFWNVGWLLTPQPDEIPGDGSTIDLYIDGVKQSNQAVYNVYRPDVLERFPGYANSEGSLASFYIDTTNFENGVHTIHWIVADDNGDAEGIGSRYFRILNSGTASAASRVRLNSPGIFEEIPIDRSTPVEIAKGHRGEPEYHPLYPGEDGDIAVEIEELELLNIRLNIPGNGISSGQSTYSGCLMVGDRPRRLPVGSTLNTETGVFSWGPAPGCFGLYRLAFIETGPMGRMNKRLVNVRIVPKSCKQ